VANRRRTDAKGQYKERVLDAETYKELASILPGVGTAMSATELIEELEKENPDYVKVGLLAGSEIIGLIPGLGSAAKAAIRQGAKLTRQTKDVVSNVPKVAKQPFKKTRKAYRIATQAEDGKLYPLFVNADDEIPVGQWISASIPPITFKGKNGNMYVPSKGAKRSKGEKAKPTGDMQVLPDKETADQLREAGFAVEKPSKAAPFGKVRAVASRPGYHATTKPVAHHLGPEDLVISEAEKKKLVKAGITPKAFKEKTFNYLDGKLISKKKIADLSEAEKKKVTKQKKFYVKRRAEDQVFLEVEMADDTSEELLEYMKARGRTDINDKLPRGGSYTYQDGQADAETWVVGGDMKVNRVLSREEALATQNEMGVKDLPLRSEVESILRRNFSNGGLVEEGIDMYQGQDDSLLVKGMAMARGGTVEEQMEMFETGEVDPISGNEVPTGSLPEEVRDDIPAQLSEGEYVVPADVVRYWGVKVFEDMRREAKMGFEEMDEDGRIGGEPMTMELGDGMGLELSDLEVMEMPDDTPEVEEAFLGKFFAGIRESNRRQQEKNRQSVRDRFKAAEERKSVDKIKAGTNKKPKFKNKAEELLYNLTNRNKSTNDDRRVTLTQKPPTSDDDRSSGTIAEQINFGGDYDKTEKKKATPKTVKPGGRATPFVDDAPEKEGVNLRSTESFGTKFMRGLGVEGYNEGGDVFKQKGGFDMSEATPVEGTAAGEVTEGMTMEAVIYVNDAGHEITIMFANGVPITPIPAGYYPKSETVAPETGTQGGGGNDDPPETPQPQSINYKELSITELTEMVKEQGDLKGSVMAGLVGALNPFLGLAAKAAMILHQKNIEKELKRRRADPTTSNVDNMRLDNLIEYTEREKPNFIDKITGKAFEKTVSQIPKPVTPDEDYSDPTMAPSVATPYTPEATTPEVTESGTLTDEQMAEIEKASRESAEIAFGKPNPFEGSTYDEVAAPVVDPDPEDTASSNVTTPTVRGDSRQERDAQRRRDRQEANRNMAGQSTSRKTRATKSATRGLSSKQKQGGAGLDSRFGISGLKDGGLVDKPTVEKVVKGLEKASKSHAKQAASLKKALGKKSK